MTLDDWVRLHRRKLRCQGFPTAEDAFRLVETLSPLVRVAHLNTPRSFLYREVGRWVIVLPRSLDEPSCEARLLEHLATCLILEGDCGWYYLEPSAWPGARVATSRATQIEVQRFVDAWCLPADELAATPDDLQVQARSGRARAMIARRREQLTLIRWRVIRRTQEEACKEVAVVPGVRMQALFAALDRLPAVPVPPALPAVLSCVVACVSASGFLADMFSIASKASGQTPLLTVKAGVLACSSGLVALASCLCVAGSLECLWAQRAWGRPGTAVQEGAKRFTRSLRLQVTSIQVLLAASLTTVLLILAQSMWGQRAP